MVAGARAPGGDEERRRPVTGWRSWDEGDAAAWIAVPQESSDKYSRGVLGVVTGSDRYPGAAVLGVEGASRTGVGMIRYLGADRPSDLVMRRRPEIVTAPGRVQGWLIGSGMDASSRPDDDAQRLRAALRDGTPLVIDAGALDLVGRASAPVIVTPHFRELATVLASGADDDSDAVTADDIAADPGDWAMRAADSLGVTVLLKGSATYVASPAGARLVVSGTTDWLATAGTGDVLGGILGALVATHSAQVKEDPDTLAALAATAALVQGNAASIASGGGPIAALDVAQAVPAAIAALLA